MDIKDFSFNLELIYREMSESFSHYQKQTQLSCLTGCGRCCLNPEIEASPLEMIPLALHLHQTGELDFWLDKLEVNEQQSCLLYVPASPDGLKGQCGHYEYRPSICRMFGVAGYFDKHKNATLSICKYIKEADPELARQRTAEATLENTPMLLHWMSRLSQLDPKLSQQRMPLNQALQRALEKVALYAQYQTSTSVIIDR
jgi:uncharacterized protein